MARGEGRRKKNGKKGKRRKKREDTAAQVPLRIDFHVHLPTSAPGEPRQGSLLGEPYDAAGVPRGGPAAAAPAPEPPPTGTERVSLSPSSGPSWPIGPHYLRWVEGKGGDAWARFKLKAADWYLSALESAEAEVGLDRYVGVEMAIDGVLACVLAGVDAAGHALFDEVERFAGPSRRDGEVPDWSAALAIAEEAGIELACRRAVEKALRGDETGERDGWLTELRRLQRLAVRRNVLVRRPSVDGSSRNRLLDVPGVGQRPVLRHLSRARQRSEALVEAILADVESLGEERLRPGRRQGPGVPRALPDLAARADVVPSHWRAPEGR